VIVWAIRQAVLHGFQFLIGRLDTGAEKILMLMGLTRFQFLIGRLDTGAGAGAGGVGGIGFNSS